ncbi:hypothetical protein GALMADRAFT_77508 [Galerina marginata CBS 339.88]|uniref:Uncharacterized protein n=1 Tax=Galerina marginata (strain CBS 339.88) TaxID=685588 RepID=A0A067SRC0_GALM3|nr:hypothetical protein GALMADRAFT_77508 [Galerina marginata CBS 339.88]
MQQHQQQHHIQQHQQQHPLNITHVAPKDTQHIQQQPVASTSAVTVQQQGQQQPQASGSGSNTTAPLIARGDWTKDLVHLAKTAELKKHALTLQLHTAHILSAHASLEQKGSAIQNLREQKNKLESERARLLNSLREINEDRDKVDLMESSLEKECRETRAKIAQLTETDYAVAKADVDRLRGELGQAPLPSLQSTLEEKTAQYLNERRLSGNDSQSQSISARNTPVAGPSTSNVSAAHGGTTNSNSNKRSAPVSGTSAYEGGQAKRPRGRPKGSKNKSKGAED